MILNKISAVITQEQESQVIKLFKEARSVLDFLVNLTSIVWIRLAKLSRGRVDFVDTSLVEAKANPKYVIGSLYYHLTPGRVIIDGLYFHSMPGRVIIGSL